jgi:hypothetical protein
MNLYAITTHHNRNTRHEHLTQLIENLELETDFYVHPILATDWRIFEYSTLKPQQYKHQSLTLAYYQICQTAVFSQQSQFVIIEDDLNITNLRKFLELIMFEPDDIHLCYLALTKHNQEAAEVEPYNHLWNKVKANYWETPATLWTIEMAQKFIEWIEKKLEKGLWLGHIDHELLQMHETLKLNYYCPVEQCCYGLSSEPEKAKGIISLDGSISVKP